MTDNAGKDKGQMVAASEGTRAPEVAKVKVPVQKLDIAKDGTLCIWGDAGNVSLLFSETTSRPLGTPELNVYLGSPNDWEIFKVNPMAFTTNTMNLVSPTTNDTHLAGKPQPKTKVKSKKV